MNADELKAAADRFERLMRQQMTPEERDAYLLSAQSTLDIDALASAMCVRLAANKTERAQRVFTDEQCFILNAAQHDTSRHPYTCGNDSTHRPLIATPRGWRCAECDYTQDWAHGIETKGGT